MLKFVLFCFVALASAATKPSGQVGIVRQIADISPEGSYQYAYELENGIKAEEQGVVKNLGPGKADLSVQGSYGFISPEGEQVQVSYVADENGYQPQGSHLPVAPDVPEAILRALQWSEAHPDPDAGKYE